MYLYETILPFCRFGCVLGAWRDVTGSQGTFPVFCCAGAGTCRHCCARSGSAPRREKLLTAADVTLTKDLLYDTYTLEDTYPYKDTVRSFKWDVIRNCLAYIENMQRDCVQWVVLQNYKNLNREAPLVRKFVRNAYRRVADTLGVERYQSVPLVLAGRYAGARTLWQGWDVGLPAG